jgi:GMP synthase-like glutamine amidotransferase
MPSVLVLQADALDPPDLIGERLEAQGIAMTTLHTNEGERAGPRGLAADGLLIMGGPQSVTDAAHGEMIEDMAEAVRRFHGAGRPVLGVCLGGQVVAHALGGRVRRVGELQFGFLEVSLGPEAAGDPLLGSLPARSRVFCWHEDCFSLPADAVHLARSDRVDNYGFRVGSTTYGFQCHFEFTAAGLDRAISRGGHFVPKNLGARGEALLASYPRDRDRHLPGANRFGTAIADAWGAMVLAAADARRATAEAM